MSCLGSITGICLPFEILATIFEVLDNARDLYHIRMASRAFCAAATPIAFRVLYMISTRESAENLGRLFDRPDITTFVKEFAYDDIVVEGRILRLWCVHSLMQSTILRLIVVPLL